MNDATDAPAGESAAVRYSLPQLAGYMLGLGTWGFGGPVALIGYMYRDLVERRRWITETDYKEGLALAQLMPGPLAAQLAIYLGYVHYRVLGATVAGLAFVLPSFLMVLALGAAYVAYGGIGWMQAVFYGVGAAVIGIIAMSACKLTSKNIGRDRLLWAIFLVSAALTVITQSEIVWVFLGAGVLKEYGWLTDRQFVDAVAVAMITPGPVVITTGFIGYLVAGFWGAVVAAIATFLPCYVLTIVPAPYFKKHGKRPALVAFVDGVTAAAVGAIAGAVVVIGQRSISDWTTAALALLTAGVLWRFKKVPEPLIVLAAALIGLALHPLRAYS
jgi:chromate transporter